MKKLIAGMLLLISCASASAGTYAFNCNMVDISCKGLFGDLVSNKFTARFPHERFEIFVFSDGSEFGDGSGITYATVGVAPISKSTYHFVPARLWSSYQYSENVGNAYDKQEQMRRKIRVAVEAMMAACEDSTNCDILGSK